MAAVLTEWPAAAMSPSLVSRVRAGVCVWGGGGTAVLWRCQVQGVSHCQASHTWKLLTLSCCRSTPCEELFNSWAELQSKLDRWESSTSVWQSFRVELTGTHHLLVYFTGTSGGSWALLYINTTHHGHSRSHNRGPESEHERGKGTHT